MTRPAGPTPAEIARAEAMNVYGRTVPGRRSIRLDDTDRTLASCTGPAPAELIRELVNELSPVRLVSGRINRAGIEQCIARGWDNDRVATTAGAPLADVVHVRADMEALTG